MNYRPWAVPILGFGWLLAGACEGPPRLLPCSGAETYSGGRCWQQYEVRVNTVGYLLGRAKRGAAFEGGNFDVRTPEGDVVWRGKTGDAIVAPDTNEKLYPLDFSAWDEPGDYFVQLESGSRSATFNIGAESAELALRGTMVGLYGLRCGVEVDFTWGNGAGPRDAFEHKACHLAEAKLDLIGSGTKDDTGGWHDAGDYGKYTVNSAFAVAFLLKAYAHYPTFLEGFQLEIPEAGGGTPDLLDEARVELEWLLKVQLEDGSFAHKVTAKNFEGTLMPESDTQARFFSPVGTAATGGAVGALALAARLFSDFDRDFAVACLHAAERGQKFLEEHPDLIQPDLAAFSTGAYLANDGDGDERLWAQVELFEATGQASFLRQAEKALGSPKIQAYFDWYGSGNLAYDSYLRSRRPGRDPALVDKVAAAFVAAADPLVERSSADPYGRGSSSYSWGSNGATARLTFTLAGAYFVDPKPEYLDAAQGQLDYLFGRNPFGRSFLTGVGHQPPAFPHHRPSGSDGIEAPWPGLLVGGPHAGGTSPPISIPALKWQDASDDYNHNEIAINWNTALAYGLAMVLGTRDPEAPCQTLGAGGACPGSFPPIGLGGFGGQGDGGAGPRGSD